MMSSGANMTGLTHWMAEIPPLNGCSEVIPKEADGAGKISVSSAVSKRKFAIRMRVKVNLQPVWHCLQVYFMKGTCKISFSKMLPGNVRKGAIPTVMTNAISYQVWSPFVLQEGEQKGPCPKICRM
ncbi:hypothetical protein TNCT_690001 [Trichonephila clavata]|uniref:Uncharacterized protein n=1 Tax=Trichonephila clavata TaxID=2740835 RepID=A0A8X6HNU2_TRICU|nr:hypothetical protein TNCT_690001 [Trichonephila clavata]